MGEDFISNIANLTGNRLNIYLPRGLTETATGIYSTGMAIKLPRSLKVMTDEPGWLGINPKGQLNNFKSITLSIDNVSKPVNVVK